MWQYSSTSITSTPSWVGVLVPEIVATFSPCPGMRHWGSTRTCAKNITGESQSGSMLVGQAQYGIWCAPPPLPTLFGTQSAPFHPITDLSHRNEMRKSEGEESAGLEPWSVGAAEGGISLDILRSLSWLLEPPLRMLFVLGWPLEFLLMVCYREHWKELPLWMGFSQWRS